MFEHGASDLHLHLNGCFSLDFLEQIARKNNATQHFLALQEIHEEYKGLAIQEVSLEVNVAMTRLIWAQFAVIHNIIQTITDIEQGTVNVINFSKTKYMEIRTTPKCLGASTFEDYIAAFITGLQIGNAIWNGEKTARGLLSLDRTLHNQETAYQIIELAEKAKNQSGLLVGIDISGNPAIGRALTGESLAFVLCHALNKNLGITLHIGEVNSEIEKKDVDIILRTLTAWQNKNPNQNIFQGKVRLNHGFFLTENQQLIIEKYQIPVEICPSFHAMPLGAPIT